MEVNANTIMAFILAFILNVLMVILIMKLNNIIKAINNLSVIKSQPVPNKDIIKHTDDFIEYIQKVSRTVASIKWREYRDNHRIDILTKEQLKNLAEDIANTVRTTINFDNINYDELIMSKEYISWLIVNYTFATLKALSESDIDNI